MDNKDLLRQYVDTGLKLPEYQMNLLSDADKKTYIRKRLISTEQQNTNLYDYEYSLINDVSILLNEFKKLVNHYHSWVSPKTYLEDIRDSSYLNPIVEKIRTLYGDDRTKQSILGVLVDVWARRGKAIPVEMVQYFDPELLKTYCNAQLDNIFANGRDLTYDNYLINHADVVVPEYLRYFKNYDKSTEILTRWSKGTQRTYLSLIEPFLKMPAFNQELSSMILFLILLHAEDIYKPQIFRLFLKNGGSMEKIQYIEADGVSVTNEAKKLITKWYEEFKDKI